MVMQGSPHLDELLGDLGGTHPALATVITASVPVDTLPIA